MQIESYISNSMQILQKTLVRGSVFIEAALTNAGKLEMFYYLG